MGKKRKTLPKDFQQMIDAGDIEALKSVFDTCDVEAVGGYHKTSALSAHRVPGELVRFLVGRGADINAADQTYEQTALHYHAGCRGGDLAVFLELGADANARDRDGDTPLHIAAWCSHSVRMVTQLIAYGADPAAENDGGRTPLSMALGCCEPIDVEGMADIADILLKAGSPLTPDMSESVTRIGKEFEFHRPSIPPGRTAAAEAALERLYRAFGVEPAERRVMHDGVSPIVPAPGKPMDQHRELWGLLIPSKGAAGTVQGEVIRITGRVHDELSRNGGVNWDAPFRDVLDALTAHLSSGEPLASAELEESRALAKKLQKNGQGGDEAVRLCELAVRWVVLNTLPIPLEEPGYGI